MLTWKLRTLYANFTGSPLVKDADGKIVSAQGVAYDIERTPSPGRFGRVEVNLLGVEQPDGSAVIPDTRLPGLTVFAADTPLAVEAAIRMLLWRADYYMLRMQRVAAEVGFFEVAQKEELEPMFTQEQADFVQRGYEAEQRERQKQLEEE